MANELQDTGGKIPGEQEGKESLLPLEGTKNFSLFVERIHLGNLAVEDLVVLLEELLNSNAGAVEELADIIHKKSELTLIQ